MGQHFVKYHKKIKTIPKTESPYHKLKSSFEKSPENEITTGSLFKGSYLNFLQLE